MADDEDSQFSNSRFSNGFQSNFDRSNNSTPSSASFSTKLWSAAQNFTRSVLRSATPKSTPITTTSSTTHAPVSNSYSSRMENPNRPMRSYEGYVSNDEDDFDGFDQVDERSAHAHSNFGGVRTTSGVRASEEMSKNPTIQQKRTVSSTLDESIVFPASKRSRMAEASMTRPSELSSRTSRTHYQRFWTNQSNSPRRPESARSMSRPLLLSTWDKETPSQNRSMNVSSIASNKPNPQPPRPFSSASSTSGATSFTTLSSISEIAKKHASRNSETKRILMDLERVGSVSTPDSKRPRLWFQSVQDQPPLPRVPAKKMMSFCPPPTSSLRTTEKADVLPMAAPPSSMLERHSERTIREEPVPLVQTLFKRPVVVDSATLIRASEPSKDRCILFGKETLPSACRFTFSKAIPVDISKDKEKTLASVLDISRSKMVPYSTAQTTTLTSAETVLPTSITAATFGLVLPPSIDSVSKSQMATVVPTNGVTSEKNNFEDSKKATKWKCSSCHFNNCPDDASCISCKAPKSGVKEVKTTTSAGGGESWNCGTCFIKNGGEAGKCIACATDRPSKPKSTAIDGGSTKTNGAVQISKSTWSCSMCFVSNDSSANECACCKSARPNIQQQQAPAAIPASDSWWCGCCSVKNNGTSSKCMACSTERPAKKEEPTKPIVEEKKSAANWSCTTCFLSNTADRVKCIVCDAPKPGSAFKPVRLGATLFGSTPVNGSGASTILNKPPESAPRVTFGLPAKPAIDVGATLTKNSLDSPFGFGLPAKLTAAVAVSEENKSKTTAGETQLESKSLEFGTTKPLASTTPFEFGMPKPGAWAAYDIEAAGATSEGQKKGGFSFGNGPSTTAAAAPTATFGFGSMVKSNGNGETSTFTAATTSTTPLTFASVSSSSSGFGSVEKPRTNGTGSKLAAFPTMASMGDQQRTTTIDGGSTMAKKSSETPFAFGFPAKSAIEATGENKLRTTASDTQLASKPFEFGAAKSLGVGSPFEFGKPKPTGTAAAAASSTTAPFDFQAAVATSEGQKTGGFSFGNGPSAASTAFSFGSIGKSNGNGETSSTKSSIAPLHFPSFSSASSASSGGFGSLVKSTTNGTDSKSAAIPAIAFPSSTAGLFGNVVTKSLNGSASSPSLAAAPATFPPLPTASGNPFSVTGSPVAPGSATPVVARRHLVAKRKAKRM